MNTVEDFDNVIEQMENELGCYRANNFHVHFSRIEYGRGGEKRHMQYSDICYGPDFDPLAEVLYKRNLSPVIICESRGMMAEDALKMKEIYRDVSNNMEMRR